MAVWCPSLVGLLCLAHAVLAFHNGAPCSTQYTMTPSTIFHGVPQNPGPRPPPYEFEILDSQGNPVTKYKDEIYKIKITAVQTTFRGFLLQARPATAEGYPIGHLRAGMFIRDSTWKTQGIKVQPCPGVFNDSLTHATNDDRSTLEVQWRPTRNHGPILFMVTIIQNRTLFWTQWLPSSGLILPDETAEFASGGEFAKLASGVKNVKVNGKAPAAKVALESEAGTTAVPEEKETTEAPDVTTEAAEAPEVETTTVATKPPRTGKGRSKTRRTTTAAPAETTEAVETTNQEVSTIQETTEAAPTPIKKTPEPGPPPSGIDRLPPAPAAAVAPGDDDSEGEELRPATRRPLNKGKQERVTTQSAGDREAGSSRKSIVTAGPDDEGPPPSNPVPSNPAAALPPLPSDKRPGGKLLPAAPAGVEELTDSNSNPGPSKPAAPVPILAPQLPSQLPPQAGAVGPPGAEAPDTTDYCAEKPCINNGTCFNVPDEERYDCRCPPDWAGQQCALPNLCRKHKCKNGAECINGENKYTCKCAREWAGEFCDNKCPSYLCENGGTCILTGAPGSGTEQYGCICAAGYTGPRCHSEIKHCDSNPCQNGATCIHRFNAFDCKCKDGYMGETCHRPCQDIYRSCDFWGEQEKCETQRPTTKWFDINCAKTCGQCRYKNTTAVHSITLPPVLEPFDFLLGRWTINSTAKNRFPVDFIHNNSQGYFEELIFSIAEVPQFGPPSINFSAVARNTLNPDDVMVTVGFLTVRPATIPLRTFLMTTTNDGITVVEDGFMNNTVIHLNSTYFAILPLVDDRAPATAKRTFSIVNSYLKEDVERTTNSGQKDLFTKYYWRQEAFPIY